MAKGKFHDRFNIFMGSVTAIFLLGLERSWPLVITFLCGWLIATLVLSPDIDLKPRKRLGLSRIFLYPYSLLFKHRGISHSIIFGTLTRIIYGIILLGILIFIFQRMGYIKITSSNYWHFFWNYFSDFDYSKLSYKIVVWFFSGMFLADFCHIILDRITGFFKRVLKSIGA